MQLKKLKISESEITHQIRQYLKMRGIFHWRVHQGLGSAKGIPDILGILPGGRLLAIEVKTQTGKPSTHQGQFLKEAQCLGANAFVARSFEDVQKNLYRTNEVTKK